MATLLPAIVDRDHYKELFPQNHLWEKAIIYLASRHGLVGKPQRGVLGSHIVYRVGNFWIKLMAPLFAKDMAYEVAGLRTVRSTLSFPTPKIVAEGILENWAYIILSHIEGEAIRNVWRDLSDSSKSILTRQIAQVSTEMKACKTDAMVTGRFDWNIFITEQYQNWQTHQTRKMLPKPWLDPLEAFLHSFELDEFLCPKPVFLHADLTFDHFLVTLEPEAHISGVIDMADCQVGHFEYELVAPLAFIFRGQKEWTTYFLLNCGFPKEKLNKRFSQKLLAWSFLHRYYSFYDNAFKEMNQCSPGDFEALAEKCYPL